MKLLEIMNYLERLAPLAWQESWDKSGLAIGDPEQEIHHILLALDMDGLTLEEAGKVNADLILTHHPLFFQPLAGVRPIIPEERIVRDLVKRDIAVYAMHTNLDAAPWGVNDSLVKILGLGGEVLPDSLVPLADQENFTDQASWLGFTDQTYLQDLFPGSEFYRGQKPGFVKIVSGEWTRRKIQDLCLMNLGRSCFVNFQEDAPVSRIAVSGGSWDGTWLDEASKRGVNAIVTGEMKYHDQIACRERGIAIFATGHDVSERPVLSFLREALKVQFRDRLSVFTYEGIRYW